MTRTIITSFEDDQSRASYTSLIDGVLLLTEGTEADVIDAMCKHHKSDRFLLIGLDPVEENPGGKASCIWRACEDGWVTTCGVITSDQPRSFCPYCGEVVQLVKEPT